MESDKEKLARLRQRAKACRANAANTKDPTARPGLIQFAQLCEILADSIEARLSDDAAAPDSN